MVSRRIPHDVKVMHSRAKDPLVLKAFNRTLKPLDRLPVNWSTFDSKTYQQAIGALRLGRKGLPLWTAESLWQGHR